MKKAKKIFVLAQAFDRKTAKPVGSSREELIDLNKNRLFVHCKTILDVKESYESFWNHFDPKSDSIVFVQSIRKPFPKERRKKK